MERDIRRGESDVSPIGANDESGSTTSDASFSAGETYPCPVGVVTVVPVCINENRVEGGARALLGHIRPNWSIENIQFTVS